MKKLCAIAFVLLIYSLSCSSKDFAREIHLGVADFPPFVDSRKKDTGYFPKYLSHIFKKLGFELKLKILPYSRSLQYLLDREVDFVIVGEGNIEELKKNNKMINLTVEFFVTQNCLFFKGEGFLSNFSNIFLMLKSYNVGTIIESPVNRILNKYDIPFVGVNSIKSGVNMLQKERIDFFINSRIIVKNYLRENKIININSKCEYIFSKEKIFLATAKKGNLKIVKDISREFKIKRLQIND